MEIDFQLDEVLLNAFTDSILNYFQEAIDMDFEMGTPYLSREDILSDYIGIIGVSGNKKGYVIIASNRSALEKIVKCVFDVDPEDDLVTDMAGELVNTIAGNTRKYFGHEFVISAPIVISGKFESLRFPKGIPIFVIPIRFDNEMIQLIIGLE
jgi:chemotaxis protein CheX